MLSDNTSHAVNSTDQHVGIQAARDTLGINPMTLAALDIGLFRSLYKLGTPRDQLRSIFLLGEGECDYVMGLITQS